MNVWGTLEAMQTSQVTAVILSEVKIHPHLQPRSDRLIPFKDKRRSEKQSEDHSQMLCLALEASEEIELEPIWLAQIPETPEKSITTGLYVIDGHHRLKAYKKAKRIRIPARIQRMDFALAVMASKPANCSGCKLAMHKEQRLDAAWQYLTMIMGRGARPLLPHGESLRTVAGKFGIGHNTVSRMLGALREVRLEEFPPNTRDPGMGWPRWKYVRMPKSIWQTPLEMLPDSARTLRNAEALARRIVNMIENSEPEERALALQMLASEEIPTADPSEAVNFLADAARPYGTHVEYVLSHWNRKKASQVQQLCQNKERMETVEA